MSVAPFIVRPVYFDRLSSAHLYQRKQQQYEGMGLGLFIAKTLLERTGATLSFSNSKIKNGINSQGPLKDGAVVHVSWPKNSLEVTKYDARSPLLENPKN